MAVGFLSDYRKQDVDQVGGKGANLGELINHGFPIPPGFIVCADEYGKALAQLQADSSHADIRAALLDWVFPDDLAGRISDCHGQLQQQRDTPLVYAVRSSATAEDLGDASFAGQHETFYYVTADELQPMIKQCWASLWNDEAIAYRDTQGIDHHMVLMAVVVQEMVPSDVSGITFTADPLTGNAQDIVTDAAWGMGAAIVDGRVTPDHYVVARDSLSVKTQRIATKTLMVSTQRSADGERMINVPHHQQRSPCLDDGQITEAAQWGLKAEQHFGTPQDLEWAFYQGQYFMLQSRPITTLGQAEDDEPVETRKLVLFKAAAENFTEPLLPLTIDVLQSTRTMEFYRGRIYSELKPMPFLVPLKLTDEQWADLMSFDLPEDFKLRVNWLMLPVSLLLWLFLYLSLGVSAARSRRMPDDFMEMFRDLVAKVDADDSLGPGASMLALFRGAAPLQAIGYDVMPINVTAVLRYFVLMGLLNKLISRWLPNNPRDAGSLLCSGSFGVKSTEMGRNIFKLSLLAKQQPEVVAIFQQHKADAIYPALQGSDAASSFLAEFHNFIREHGHRALKEFELASPRFAENPAPVLAMIKNYMQSDSNPEEMEQHNTDARVALAEQMQAELADKPLERRFGWRWHIIEYLANRARHFIKLRENSRFYHIMAWQSARKKILAAERHLMANGTLKVKNDIFYLRWVEVRALLDGHLKWGDVEDTIRSRRMQTVRWTNQGAQRLVNIESTKQARVLDHGQLGGQGASPGQYEGIARVIMDPSVDAELHPGEILVAPYTDPAWTPLFLVARAAVVGVGSYLSHAGTIAREYGMPCVVDVENCTSQIRTGDRLLVDGTTGIVYLLDERAES